MDFRREFEIFPAPAELRPFVRRYMYANQALTEPLVLHPKPTGYCYFSNSFGWSPRDGSPSTACPRSACRAGT